MEAIIHLILCKFCYLMNKNLHIRDFFYTYEMQVVYFILEIRYVKIFKITYFETGFYLEEY